MKSKQKAKIIILVLGMIFAISAVSNQNFSDDQGSNDGSVEIRDETSVKSPKKSGYWTPDFIHIQNDNWSENAFDWIQVGAGTPENPHIIENVTIDAGGTGNGILIEDSSEYFIIRNCSLTNAGGALYDAGIKLKTTNNGILINNNCSDNGRLGILLINNCENNIISGNIASNVGTTRQNFGILLKDYCNNNTISGNKANDHLGWYGIRLEIGCDNNTISGNTASNVGTTNQDNGIGLWNDCNDNTISGNTANDNTQIGIYLENDCNDNTISGNNASNELVGVRLATDCDNNIILGNLIENNQNWGINIASGDCANNLIYYNSLIGTVGSHGRDAGANNHWNTSIVGNYWDNHTSPDVIEPDGIVDIPYTWIVGVANSEDSFPLAENPVHLGEKIHIDDSGVNAWNWSKTAKLKAWCSGTGTFSDPYVIDGLEIDGGGTENGILIEDSSVYFIIRNCILTKAGPTNYDAGINLKNTNNGNLINNNCSDNRRLGILLRNYCENNIISGNIASNVGTSSQDFGILLLEYCDNNTISGNTANNNIIWGIRLEAWCDNNTISGNTAGTVGGPNQDKGIGLFYDCNDNTISGNTANDNTQDGIVLDNNCNDNTISGNTANDNTQDGIVLDNNCNNNTISGNTASDNTQYGIYLQDDCNDNNISENTAGNDGTINQNLGIRLETNCDNNIILGNLFKDNQNWGILIFSTDCSNNLIYQNSLIGTGLWHARDSGTNNMWDNGSIGNYWDNYTGIDANGDGIGDTPYTWIFGSPGGIDNFPIWPPGIKMITPENKTYTEPMSGNYPATFSFENDEDGTLPYDWVETSFGSASVTVAAEKQGHYKVLKSHDSADSSRAQAEQSFSPQIEGSIEFWLLKEAGGSGSPAELIIRGDQVPKRAIRFLIDDSGWGNTFYDEGYGEFAAGKYSDDQWFHMRIDFNCTNDKYDVYVDGIKEIDQASFVIPQDVINNFFISSSNSRTGTYYIDALGYSWDPNYNIGNNLNEFSLSFVNTTNFDWMGYSLDGQANITILGNTTIPIPENGPHTIQVFGNDSLGRNYQSQIRHFIIDIPKPPSPVISPGGGGGGDDDDEAEEPDVLVLSLITIGIASAIGIVGVAILLIKKRAKIREQTKQEDLI